MECIEHYDSMRFGGSTGIHREDIMDIFAVNNYVAVSNGNLGEEKGENKRKKRYLTWSIAVGFSCSLQCYVPFVVYLFFLLFSPFSSQIKISV